MNLQKAIELCQEEKTLEDGLKIFDHLILNGKDKFFRTKALLELVKILPSEANDKIARIRDSLTYLVGKDRDREVDMLRGLVNYPQINSFERLICAVCIYNHFYVEYCYDMFAHLANDISVLLDYRMDSVRYLMYSEVDQHIDLARKSVRKVVVSKDYPSEYRYERVIASFDSKTGLKTLLNREKLDVEFNLEFLKELRHLFFWDDENDVRSRIVCGGALLEYKDEKQKEICEVLLDFANNEDYEENIRADAADVVMSRGVLTQHKLEARKILRELGFMNGKKMNTLSEKSQTVYSDRQNVHNTSINTSVNEFIKKLIEDHVGNIQSYADSHSEISEVIYSSKLSAAQRSKAFKSLNRISIDVMTFTEFKVTTAEIMIHVWNLMKKYDKDVFQMLRGRLVEELIDMADTCTSGHAARLVNILSGYDFQIKLTFQQQLKSNMAARMQAKIKDIEDEEQKVNVILGMGEDATNDERKMFIEFVSSNILDLKEELKEEFKEFITEDDFEKWFEEGVEKWV